ncbi:MAG: DUF4395 domain-containing protein [Tetrasphaera sp.]|nr:DUF4395 domain-containing protein [Tetrasphaera sp.]
MTTPSYVVAPPAVLDPPRSVPTVVDEVTVRLVAGVVLAVGVVVLVSGQWWLYGLLAVDFALRAWGGPARSPLAQAVLRWLRPRVATAPRPTAFAPKRFAAGIGAVVSSAIVGLSLAGAPVAATVLVVAMIALPGLEAAFGFCVGCRIFAVLVRWGLLHDEVCVDCAPTRRPTPERVPADC